MRRPKNLRDVLQTEEEGRLLYLLETTDPSMQAKIALELGRRGARAAVEPLRQHISSTDSKVREAVVEALGKIGDPAVAEEILKLFTDPEQPPPVRDTCAYALARLAYGPAVPALFSALVDPVPSVRSCAVAALAAIGGAAAVKTVQLAFETETDPTVREAMRSLLKCAGAESSSWGVADRASLPSPGQTTQKLPAPVHVFITHRHADVREEKTHRPGFKALPEESRRLIWAGHIVLPTTKFVQPTSMAE